MFDLVIVGAGIAGQTAAIYAARKRMDFVLLAKEVGGQFLESGEVLNYPGILKTTGVEFKLLMDKQLEFNEVNVTEGKEVKKIGKIEDGFRVYCDSDTYDAKTVIIASGARPRGLNVPGEKEFARKGVTYCSICDGPLFSGMDVVVVGGGNSALEAVDFIKDIAQKIYLLNNGKEFNAHEYLIERVLSYKNVEILLEADTKEVLGDKFVTGLVYEKNSILHSLEVQGVIIEIGRVPNTGFLEGFLELDEHNHVVVDCQTRASVEGVFAAGDCASGHEYQYVTSAGQGCMALLKAARYLANKKL